MRFVFALMCLISTIAFAADGDPDGSFAGGALATASITAPLYVVSPSAALAADGGVLVAGTTGLAPGSEATRYAVTRFTPAGLVDSGFGNAGVAQIDFSNGAADFRAYANQIAGTPDGKWIVAGNLTAQQITGIARLHANGTLDTSFGNGGRTEIDWGGGNNIIQALHVDAANRTWLLIGTQTYDTLVRVAADGSLDTSFANGGKLVLNVSCCTYHHAMAFDAQGRILLGGARNTTPRAISVQRLLPDGSADNTFGTAGVFTFAMNVTVIAQQLLVTADGHIIVIGNSSAAGTNFGIGKTTIARMTSSGVLDTLFGVGGSRIIDFGGEEHGSGVNDNHAVLCADGKILIARATQEASGVRVSRLLADGYPDATFGPDGKRTVLQSVGFLSFAGPLLAPKRLLLTGAYTPSGAPGFFLYAQAWRDGDGIFRNGVD